LDQDSFLALFTSPATKESIQRQGDVSAIAFAIRAARIKVQETIFAYEFSAEIPGWDQPGAFHSVDLWFFFETLAKCWRPFTGKHYDLARQMCDYLFNFVRDGDPNGIGTEGSCLPYWPALDAQAPVFMSFGDTAKPVQSPASPVVRLLLEAYLAAH
jgi:para-nitrobenzyl esterase